MKVAYLGPEGTYSEEALISEPDLARAEILAVPTILEAIRLASSGSVDAAFVPIENSTEGPVTMTLDELVFGDDMFIQREVVLEIHHDLLGVSGTVLRDVREVISHPQATAQSREFIIRELPHATVTATNSTADAARIVSERGDPAVVAIAPPLSAARFGLAVLAKRIEDFEQNRTRFVLVGPRGFPGPSGHDRTSIVCFQHADRPGNLHRILGQFAARDLNLTRLESRPTKQGLGDYCFVIEFEGHVSDEVVGDILKHLHMDVQTVKLLGSYPVQGDRAQVVRAEITESRTRADRWLDELRGRIQLQD